MQTHSFINWIKKYEMSQDEMGLCGGTPINDLANDIKDDNYFPRISDRKEILAYLERRNACQGAIEAFKHAWKLYSAYKRRHL